MAFSPDGHTLATGSADNTVRLWDTATGQPTGTLTGHTSAVGAVAGAAGDDESRCILSGIRMALDLLSKTS